MEEIKSVIFDWGGVLTEDPAPGIIQYCAQKLGVSKENYQKAQNKFAVDFQKGRIDEDIFWEKICNELNVPEPPAPSLWTDAFRAVYNPGEEMFALAALLHDNGCKTALLSNTEVPTTKFFHEQKYNMFDILVFSCMEGTIKPEKEIFDITIQKIGCEPEKSVFIDDNLEFINAAKEIGINTILFESACQIRKNLTQFGLDCISRI